MADFRNPLSDRLGIQVLEASGDQVVAVLPVSSDLYQAGGILHGGAYATLVETAASIGAALWLGETGVPVGVSNHTEFLRAVREGELRAEATPLQRGGSLQLWQVDVTDDRERRVAYGMVKLMNLRSTPGSRTT